LDARWVFYCRLLNCSKHWHFQPLEPIDAWRPWFWPHHRICPKPTRIEEILGIFAQIWLLTNCSIAHLWNPVIFVAGYKLWSLILAIKSMIKLQLVSNQTTWLNSFHHHCCCCCCCYRFYHGPLQPSHCTNPEEPCTSLAVCVASPAGGCSTTSIHLFLISPVPACQSARPPAGSYKVPTPQKPRDLGPVKIIHNIWSSENHIQMNFISFHISKEPAARIMPKYQTPRMKQIKLR